jgi:hypothetical protein
MVEVAIIGDEGLVGNNAFFGAALMSREAMMQVPDTRVYNGLLNRRLSKKHIQRALLAHD